MDELNRSNLRILLRNGVTVALGSDAYSDISVAEARYLATLGVGGYCGPVAYVVGNDAAGHLSEKADRTTGPRLRGVALSSWTRIL